MAVALKGEDQPGALPVEKSITYTSVLAIGGMVSSNGLRMKATLTCSFMGTWF